jgi:hypothetical protein
MGLLRLGLAWIATIALAFSAHAAEAPALPELPDLDSIKPTLRAWPVARFYLASRQLSLGKAELARISALAFTLGDGPRAKPTEAPRALCFQILSQSIDTRIWLLSRPDAEEPGRFDELVAIREPRSNTIPLGCERLPAEFQPLSLDQWLWLGLPAREVERRLGKPSGTQGEWVRYAYAGVSSKKARTQIGREERISFESAASLDLRMLDGKVVAIRASVSPPR